MIKYFLSGFLRIHLCYALAIADLKQFFHRAFLGLLWVTISFFIFILVKNFIFSSFTTVSESEFIMWVALGYAVWVFISTSIMEGTLIFIKARPWILSLKTPPSVFIMQSLVKLSIFLFLNLSACVVIGLIYKLPLKTQAFYALIGLVLLFLNHIIWQVILGYLATKFRDIIHFAQALMRVMFFLTPILYMPAQIGDKAKLLLYNPFTHFLALVREPIIYGVIPIQSSIVVGAFTLISLIIATVIVKFQFKNLSLWV